MPRRSTIVAFIALTLAMGLIPRSVRSAVPEPPSAIAVLNFSNRNPGDGWDWLEKGLADMLITDLGTSDRLAVVERERMQILFDEMKLADGPVAATGAANLGRTVKAERVLTGSFWVQAGTLTIEAHIVDVKGAKLTRVEQVEGRATEALALEKKLARAILRHLHVPITDAQEQVLARLPTCSVEASTAFYEGIDLWDKGKPLDAIAAMRLALSACDEYPEAAFRLGQLYALVGEGEHALATLSRLLAGQSGSDWEADALFLQGMLLLRDLGRPAESIAVFRRLATRDGPFRIRSLWTPRMDGEQGPRRDDYAQVLLADALAECGDAAGAGAIYADLYKDFTRDVLVSGTGRYDRDYGARRKLLQQRLDDLLARADPPPVLDSCMIVLRPGHTEYTEDYRTDERFVKGFAIRSHERYRDFFIPARGSSPATFHGGNLYFFAFDYYRVVADPEHLIRRVQVSITGSAGARLSVQEGKRGWKRFVHDGADGTWTSEWSDCAMGTAYLRLTVAPGESRINSWTLRAELAPRPSMGSLRIETVPSPIDILIDGHAYGASPLTVPRLAVGKHTVRADSQHICVSCSKVHREWMQAYGSFAPEETDAIVEAGRTTRVLLELREASPGAEGWAPIEAVPLPDGATLSDAVVMPNGEIRAFATRDGDIWTLVCSRGGKWSQPERLPLPVNTFKNEGDPRCFACRNGQIRLVWNVAEHDRMVVLQSISADGRRWQHPTRIAAIPCEMPRHSAVPRNIVMSWNIAVIRDDVDLLAWTDRRPKAPGVDVYVQRFDLRGPVGDPVQVKAPGVELLWPQMPPVIVCDRTSRIYLVLCYRNSRPNANDTVVLTSQDGGSTWSYLQSNDERIRTAWLDVDGRICATRFIRGRPSESKDSIFIVEATEDFLTWTPLGTCPGPILGLRAKPQPNGWPMWVSPSKGNGWILRATTARPSYPTWPYPDRAALIRATRPPPGVLQDNGVDRPAGQP